MANVTITLTAKEKSYLESISGESAKKILQGVVDRWLDDHLTAKVKDKMTKDDKIDKINT